MLKWYIRYQSKMHRKKILVLPSLTHLAVTATAAVTGSHVFLCYTLLLLSVPVLNPCNNITSGLGIGGMKI